MTHPAPTELSTKALFRLDGRTIVISGGAGSVGSTVGKAVLESGGDAIFIEIAPQPEASRWNNIEATATANGTKAWYHRLNVTDADAIPPVFDTIRSQIRYPLRGLVACTGISGVCDATSYPIDAFRKIIDVNIAGAFLTTQAIGREMHRATVPGSIVLIASMSGWISNRCINGAAYNASKSAVHQLARSLAAEWGHPQNTFDYYPAGQPKRKVHPPIRVNTISPGHIETPLTAEAQETGLVDDWVKQNMLGRISQVEEYSAPVLFLLESSRRWWSLRLVVETPSQALAPWLVNRRGCYDQGSLILALYSFVQTRLPV
ncbi:NAD(P)-binding protein [Bimuria novae-zelandiae CBS 107.79]|uniref:NAD(P)-binding protein n=1 Tax=Bimuria novae-zelandiae CBS 107.79 TaxID=1447943 RepID=A0A6A5VSK6_9PLEO|nr:NAD(P)-binding protein [Bimuria novae-zelandiae CBS 107.79]